MGVPRCRPPLLGRLLRNLRLRLALSQEELAARSGVSARTISDLERGQRADARFETIRMLADVLVPSPEDRSLLMRAAQTPLIEITLLQPPAAPVACQAPPAPTTSLIGRDREVEEVAYDVTDGGIRLLTLTGPGGVGKIRLALTVANEVAGRFPGGVGWADLSPLLVPSAVIPTIADGLSVLETPQQLRSEGLRRRFGDRRFLLVLDNFEQLIGAAPDIVDLLTMAPSLTVLVTSRALLRVSVEVAYPVTPLTVPAPDAAPLERQDAGQYACSSSGREGSSRTAEALGIPLWWQGAAGPYQAIPQPGPSWQPRGRPEHVPHEYVRGGTAKLLTLFRPATGEVRARPGAGAPNAILHPWREQEVAALLAEVPPPDPEVPARAAVSWAWDETTRRWAAKMPPVRRLLIRDNLAGHHSGHMVAWLLAQGVWPLFTPLGGSWLNLAESVQRILVRRALNGQHPQSAEDVMSWLG